MAKIDSKETSEERFTLHEAFEFEQKSASSTLDLEKAIRSIAYLLDWKSGIGEKCVPGELAAGR